MFLRLFAAWKRRLTLVCGAEGGLPQETPARQQSSLPFVGGELPIGYLHYSNRPAGELPRYQLSGTRL